MPGRPLTAIVTLGLLVCGATVGLEAVGVLFQAGASNSEQHTDAFLRSLEADLDSQVAPSRPVDLPSEAAAVEPVWLDPPTTAEPAPDATREAADIQTDQVGDKKMVVAFTAKLPQSLPPESTPPEEPESTLPEEPQETASPPEAERAPAQPAVQEPEPVVVQPAAQTAEPARPQPQRAAAHARSRSARADRAGAGGFGCPLLDWLSL